MATKLSSPSISRKSPELVSQYIHIPDDVNTFEFDACLIDESFILKNIVGHIFKKTLSQVKYDMNEISLSIFINSICDHYNRNHFHNFQHATNVLQMTYMLLDKTEIINKLNPHIVFAALLSALSHDVDHPGNTNSYEINSMSKYAKLYNDISVLENHHCSLTFELMERTGIIKNIKDEHFRDIRKTIIMCILGTDMSKHNDYISKFDNFNFQKLEYTIDEQIFICSSFVHFADLSNPIKNFDACFEWSRRISLEFFEQTVKEENEGLPSLSFMKVHDKLSMSLNEISFITNISVPTWSLFVSKFKNLEFILDKVKITLDKWKDMEKKYISDNDINSLNY